MIFGQRKPSAAIRAARDEVETSVPPGMRIAGAWGWRLLVLAGVLGVLVFLVIQLQLIVIPVMVAILVAALLVPFSQFLQRHRWPRWLAIAVAEIGLLTVIAGLIYVVVWQIRSGLPDLQKQTLEAYRGFVSFLEDSPLDLSQAQINEYVADIVAALQADSGVIVSGAVSFGATAGHLAAGFLLVLFATLFMLIDGRGIWLWTVRLFPRTARRAVNGAGQAGWRTLTEFVKVQIFVAAVDAVGIGLFAFFFQVPLAIPIAIAVFLGSFVPVVGAVATGVIAVFIALIYNGPLVALGMLIGVLIVQQIEGHVLQPLVMGTAVKVHPLAVVLAVAAGGFLAGIPGALFAVPVVATVNAMIGYIAAGTWRHTTDPDAKDLVKHA